MSEKPCRSDVRFTWVFQGQGQAGWAQNILMICNTMMDDLHHRRNIEGILQHNHLAFTLASDLFQVWHYLVGQWNNTIAATLQHTAPSSGKQPSGTWDSPITKSPWNPTNKISIHEFHHEPKKSIPNRRWGAPLKPGMGRTWQQHGHCGEIGWWLLISL